MNIAYEPGEVAHYEKYYGTERLNGLDKNKVTARKLDTFTQLMKDMFGTFRQTEETLFDTLMKLEWMDRHFEYDGKVVSDMGPRHGYAFDGAAAFFLRLHYGYTPIFWRGGLFKIIRSYADELFQDFEGRNPLEKFVFPFKHMNFESMFYVHKMEGRMDLLLMGEKHQMNYNAFRDYVLACQSKFYKDTKKEHKQYYGIRLRTAPYLAEKKKKL